MRNFILLLFIIVIVKANAQDYQINFAGKGASTTVASVKVENLTTCKSLTMTGSNILHLSSTVGIGDINTEQGKAVHVYPNPMTENCFVNFNSSDNGTAIISIFDISGKMISQLKDFLLKGEHTYNINGLGSGIYTLKIESDKYSYTEKIISNSSSQKNVNIKHAENGNTDNTSPASYSKSQKNEKSIIEMHYETGDILKFTGISGNYKTISMLIPTQSQSVTFNFVECRDPDNNYYAVVVMGTQIWMAENLKTTQFNDETPISNITDGTNWSDATTPAYCWYDNDIANKNIYGALYNWYAGDSGILCPAGWHFPNYTEWWDMIQLLPGHVNTGGGLKEACSSLWLSPNTGAKNLIGFSGLPGGYRWDYNGKFANKGMKGRWWDDGYMGGSPNLYSLGYDNGDLYTTSITYELSNGYSVRCVKD